VMLKVLWLAGMPLALAHMQDVATTQISASDFQMS
jgi:hypothetical protein